MKLAISISSFENLPYKARNHLFFKFWYKNSPKTKTLLGGWNLEYDQCEPALTLVPLPSGVTL
jgi:hypothetical protein